MIELVLAIALGIVLAYLIITNLAAIGYILLAIIVLAILYGIFSVIVNGLNKVADVVKVDEKKTSNIKITNESVEKIDSLIEKTENLFDFNKRLSKIKDYSIIIYFLKIVNYIFYPFEYLFLKSNEYLVKYKYLSFLITPLTIILMFSIFAFYLFILLSIMYIFVIK